MSPRAMYREVTGEGRSRPSSRRPHTSRGRLDARTLEHGRRSGRVCWLRPEDLASAEGR